MEKGELEASPTTWGFQLAAPVNFGYSHISEAQVWWDMGPGSQIRTWSGEAPDPFKVKVSPLRAVPGAEDPGRIQPDVLHCFNLGFGKNFCASGILLLCRHNVFAGSSRGEKLEAAYDSFQAFCESTGKTSSLKCFELKTFKITSQPGCTPCIYMIIITPATVV